MGIKVITPATLEPITLSEAKLQCKVEGSDDDTLLGLFIAAARDKAEQYMGAAIMQRTLDMMLDRFPWPGEADIRIDHPPAWNDKVPVAVPLAILSVKYIDEAGVQQTLASDQYTLDDSSWPFWLLPAFGVGWPPTRFAGGLFAGGLFAGITDVQANAVTIRVQLGYDDATKVPGGIRAWLLLTTAFLYANREAFVLEGKGAHVAEIPSRFVDSLLDPYRVFTV